MATPVIQRLRRRLLPSGPGTGDIDARSAARNRRAAVTGAASMLARILQIGSSLVTVPLTLKYLGNERFGLWMTISSVLAMAAFADFGIGNGVLNTVATASGRDDVEGVRTAVSNGFAVLNAIALTLIVLFFLIYPFVSWADFFGVTSSQARAEAGPAVAVFAVCFALNISMDVVQRVQLGLQQGYRFALWQLAGSGAGFVGIIVGIWLHSSLPILIVAVAGAPTLATALNFAHFFGVVRADLRPSMRGLSRKVVALIARLGGFFFVLQVVGALSFSADNFLIARILGAVNVPDYAIPQRMFGLITMALGMFIAPLWPAYGEAISRGDITWVRRTMSRSLLIVLSISTIAATVLLFLAPSIISLWVGSRIHPPFLLLLGIALWTVVNCGGDALGVFLNGSTNIRFQVVVASVFGITCVGAKILLLRHIGISGIPWAALLAYLLINVPPYLWYVPRLLKRLGVYANKSAA